MVESANSRCDISVSFDEGGFPAPNTPDGRAMPFWSSLSRVQRIIKTVPAYRGFQPHEIPWAEFCERWVPNLMRDGVRAGVNWSGPCALGYDIEATKLQQSVEAIIDQAPSERT
jgi:hypothetical protein